MCNLFFLLAFKIYPQPKEVVNHTLEITTPRVALLSVKNSNSNTTLFGFAPKEAGNEISFDDVNESTWINYSSIVGTSKESSRHITVQISNGELPKGFRLLVTVKEDNGFGDGKMGKPFKKVRRVKKSPTKIIHNIGSCYTGVGVNKGHNVVYKIELVNKKMYKNLRHDNKNAVSLLYTLSDD